MSQNCRSDSCRSKFDVLITSLPVFALEAFLLRQKFALRWPNTVFARAFADVIQHVHKDFKKQTCRQYSDHFIFLTPAFSVLFFSITECSALMALVFNYKDMLEKVTMPRTQQFSASVCYRKNPVKCNTCVVARKIETDCFSRNVPISNDPVVRILRNLAKK